MADAESSCEYFSLPGLGEEVCQTDGALAVRGDGRDGRDGPVNALRDANAALAALNETQRREDVEEAKERERSEIRVAEMEKNSTC